MGVGSEVCGALVNGCRGLGVELKWSYYQQAQKNIQACLKDGWEKESDMLPLEPVSDEAELESA